MENSFLSSYNKTVERVDFELAIKIIAPYFGLYLNLHILNITR